MAAAVALPIAAIYAFRLAHWWKRRTGHPWRWLIGALIAFAALCGIVRQYRLGPIRHADDLLARYRANPDQKTAELLADLLSFGDLPKEKGNEVLRALVADVQVHQRADYAAAREIPFSVSRPPRHLTFYNLAGQEMYKYTWEGKDLGAGASGPDGHCQLGLSGSGVFEAQEPGTYYARVEYKCSLWRMKGKKHYEFIRRPSRPQLLRKLLPIPTSLRETFDADAPPDYETVIDVPFTVVVVEPEKAQRVKLVSSKELDAAVRGGITQVGMYRESRGQRRLTGTGWSVAALPVDVVLKGHLCDMAGSMRLSEEMVRMKLHRGRATTFGLLGPWTPNVPPGTYNVRAILTPDPDAAYLEPDIKEIWGGTLELPFQITITDTASAAP